MPDFTKYKLMLVKVVREQETRKANGDVQKLIDLAECDDEFLLKKWSLIFFIVGGPSLFIALPLVLFCFSLFMPALVMDALWLLTKGLMLVFLVLFSFAAVISLRSKPG